MSPPIDTSPKADIALPTLLDTSPEADIALPPPIDTSPEADIALSTLLAVEWRWRRESPKALRAPDSASLVNTPHPARCAGQSRRAMKRPYRIALQRSERNHPCQCP
ncbi:MAG: hypothetical protein GY847_29865 [Proteobacteria bacterium]|nr:hypothetical protein [Pseudomonadota bacterium]